MLDFIHFASLTIFLLTIILGSRQFYYGYLKQYSQKVLQKYGHQLDDLKYSFEEITYFVTLPSNNPLIAEASRKDLYIQKEFASLLFPAIKGVKIIVRNPLGADQFIAFLAQEHFRLPLLDKMLFDEQIDQETYNNISSYKLIHPSTVEEILDEVYKQLHQNKYLNGDVAKIL